MSELGWRSRGELGLDEREREIEHRTRQLVDGGRDWFSALAEATAAVDAGPRRSTRVAPGKLARSARHPVHEDDLGAVTALARQNVAAEPVMVHRKATGTAPPAGAPIAAPLQLARETPGAPLPSPLSVELARSFGVDLDAMRDVRVHTAPASAAAADVLAADAFTIGRDIHFARGTYQPETDAGRRLLAHEVAHTLQAPGEPRSGVSRPEDPAEREADQLADRFAGQALPQAPRDARHALGELHATGGRVAVETAVRAMSSDPRVWVSALLGVDLSFVRHERGAAADELLDEIDADGAAVGATVYLRSGLDAQRAWELEAHELTHVAQTGGGSTGEPGDDLEVAAPDSAVEQEAEQVGEQLAAFEPLDRPLTQSAPAGTVLRGKGKIVGWLVKVGERKLIKTTAIYSEKQLTKLLAKGYNVLVRDGRAAAKRIAKKVWGDGTLHHAGHIVKKTGKMGKPHYQPLRHGVGRAGEKGWHIFYSALPILFFAEDVQAMEIYEDKYPGKSVANYLTVTQYVGKDSWLRHLDWINPLELIAIGGDIGRDWDRERTKELKALIFTREGPNNTIQTYELDPEGQLVKVYIQGPAGEKTEFTAQQYYELLEKAVPSDGVETKPPAADGTTSPNYAGTFDADFRIYHSKQGWNWESETLSFFLPAVDAAKLVRSGSFYINRNDRIGYFYVIVHPTLRTILREPGFTLPKGQAAAYDAAPDKEQFLQDMLTSAITSEIMKQFDPTAAQ